MPSEAVRVWHGILPSPSRLKIIVRIVAGQRRGMYGANRRLNMRLPYYVRLYESQANRCLAPTDRKTVSMGVTKCFVESGKTSPPSKTFPPSVAE